MGYFDANAPDEMAVFTIVNGQGVWSIASGVSPRTVTFGQAGDIPEPGDYLRLGLRSARCLPAQHWAVLGARARMARPKPLNLGVGSSPDLSSLVPVPGAYDNLTYFNEQDAGT